MSLVGPEPYPSSPLVQIGHDVRAELRGRRARWPPGDNGVDLRRTHRLATDPLALLLDAYERHGPVLTMRILSSKTSTGARGGSCCRRSTRSRSRKRRG